MPDRYRTKRVEIEAMQLLDDLRVHHQIAQWITENGGWVHMPFIDPWLNLRTPDGEVRVDLGDWVVRHPNGQFFQCDPEVFAATYERVTAGGAPRVDSRRLAELEAFVADIACHGLRADLNPTFLHASNPARLAEDVLKYLRMLDGYLRDDARKFVPGADRPRSAGRPIPAPRVEVVAESVTELDLLRHQDGAQ